MNFFTTAVAAAGALAAAGAVSVATASADAGDPAPSTHSIGTQGTVENGGVVQGWTVSDLRPSSDAIPYQPRGTLWEATATDVAIQGTVTPVVANLGARSPSGQTYPALFTVATAQGVNPSNLAQGQKTSGKVYFDVTGDAPNSLVYQAGGADLIRWVAPAPQSQAPPAASRPQAPAAGSQAPATGGSSNRAPATGGSGHQAPARGPSAARPARPGPGTGTGSPPASSGTPLHEGSSGTPLPADTP